MLQYNYIEDILVIKKDNTMISYKPFWETIKKKGESTYSLINRHAVSSSTIQKLRTNSPLNLKTINDLCVILNCEVSDVVSTKPTWEEMEERVSYEYNRNLSSRRNALAKVLETQPDSFESEENLPLWGNSEYRIMAEETEEREEPNGIPGAEKTKLKGV